MVSREQVRWEAFPSGLGEKSQGGTWRSVSTASIHGAHSRPNQETAEYLRPLSHLHGGPWIPLGILGPYLTHLVGEK